MMFPIRQLGLVGVVTEDDFPPEEAPPNAITYSDAVAFRGGFVRKATGWEPIITDSPEDISWFQLWDNGSQISLVAGMEDGLEVSLDGNSFVPAIIEDENGLPMSVSLSSQWQSDVFGQFAIMNNGVDTPLYSHHFDGTTWHFRPLPGWGQPNSPGGPVAVIRQFKEHLIAIGVTGAPFTIYNSSTPEALIPTISCSMDATTTAVASMTVDFVNLQGQVQAATSVAAAVRATYSYPLTLTGSTTASGSLLASVPLSATMGAVTDTAGDIRALGVGAYSQHRITNQISPTSGYATRASLLAGVVSTDEATQMTVNVWFQFNQTGARTLFEGLHWVAATPQNSMLRLYKDSSGNLILVCRDQFGNGINDTLVTIASTDHGWHHVLFSVDTFLDQYNVWLDGTQIRTSASISGGMFPISIGLMNTWTVLAVASQTATPSRTYTQMAGAMADLWIAQGIYATSMAAFRDGSGNPVDLGPTDGSLPGVTPLVFFGGDMTALTGGGDNHGWCGATVSRLISQRGTGGTFQAQGGTASPTSQFGDTV